jgi:hypothetical protein
MIERHATRKSRDEAAVVSYDRGLLEAALAFAEQVFGAAAASVFTYDADADELTFEAASGIGGRELVGSRMSATSGVAGLVIQSGAATIATDLAGSSQFNREFAAKSGYLPNTICAAPLLYSDDLLGVIEVLDPQPGRFGDLEIMAILEALADQVATSLHVLGELRTFRRSTPGPTPRRTKLSNLLNALPEGAFDNGRSGILEAVLVDMARSRT